MTKSTFTKKDYDNLLKVIQDYHETSNITSSVDATQLIIKGILTGKLIIPHNVITIGDYAFCGCSGFDSLEL